MTNSWDKLEFKTQLRLELLGDKTQDFLGLNSNIVCWKVISDNLTFNCDIINNWMAQNRMVLNAITKLI